MEPLDPALLPPGLRTRILPRLNGLDVHVLEAGDPRHPLVLLLHGFPELAYSWRKIMPGIAAAGFHVAAPDLRGYGRTTGWDAAYDTDITPFGLMNLVRDQLALVAALGHRVAAMVAGHDFGASAASACALIQPDVFRSLMLMSAPYGGTPPFPPPPPDAFDLPAALAALDPPRKHYHWYYTTPEAGPDMLGAPEGLHAFLRAYFHMKSADWPGNDPHRLPGRTAEAYATLPHYYVMPLAATMPAAVAPAMPATAPAWLPDDAMAVYAAEYGRTGFQGGLDWYRARTGGLFATELSTFAGQRIAVPTWFLAGDKDWGAHQVPGLLEKMETQACAEYRGTEFVPGAGHWVQQEQPEAVLAAVLRALRTG